MEWRAFVLLVWTGAPCRGLVYIYGASLLPPAHFTTPKELYRVRRTVAAQPPQLMVHDIEMLLARDDNRRFTHQVLVDLGALCNQEPLCPDHGVEMYKYLPNVDNQPPKYEANESCTRHRGHRIVYR